MKWSFVKEALEFLRDNRSGTAINRGMMSAEAECIPRSTIYSIENRIGDHTFTRNNCFKEREMLLDAGHQQLIQYMIVNRDRMNTGMTRSEVGQKISEMTSSTYVKYLDHYKYLVKTGKMPGLKYGG